MGQKSAPKKGQIWSMIPMPPTLLGPCCLPGPNDTEHTANRCEDHEASYCIGPMGKRAALSFDEKRVWMKGTIIQEQDGENEADIA